MSASFKPLKGFKKAMKKIFGIGVDMQLVTDAGMDAMGAFLAQEVVRGLDSQAPAGMPFKPLAESTIKARARKRGKTSTKALIDTGDLRNSVVHTIAKNPTRIEVGLLRTAVHKESGLPMANLGKIHEEGVWGGFGFKIPPRPFLAPITRSSAIQRRAKKVFERVAKMKKRELSRL